LLLFNTLLQLIFCTDQDTVIPDVMTEAHVLHWEYIDTTSLHSRGMCVFQFIMTRMLVKATARFANRTCL